MSMFVWGSNTQCQLPVGTEILSAKRSYDRPEEAKLFESIPVVAVAAGDDHTLVLTNSGDVHSFGRGKDGQLGRDLANTDTVNAVGLVESLDHETVVDIAAGSVTSYAITSTGKCYHWGLIHRSANSEEETVDAGSSTSGTLTGIAADQQTEVRVDNLARAEAGPRHNNRELKALGYDNEEVNQVMENRGREYHGMLRMGCLRTPQRIPTLVRLPSSVKVAAVAAGYAHTLILTTGGQLFSCGYNDRGQLGLGHRINTSEFKHVEYLQGKTVVQVACGQQHTVCRVIDNRGEYAQSSCPVPGGGSVAIGADVYVFGNGALGQLGLGIRGTSKGRLLPTLIESLQHFYPKAIVDVSAGGNFTVVVAADGSVWSFGHSEYNQHASAAKSDYHDPFYFYVPRRVPIKRNDSLNSADDDVFIVKVSCGFNFTLGIDAEGLVYSWGWNESGVLGHGIGSYGSSVEKVSRLADAGRVTAVAAGSKHALALTVPRGCAWGHEYRYLLRDTLYADVELLPGSSLDASPRKSFLCHSAILSARSPYLRGLIKQARTEASELRSYIHRTEGGVPDDLSVEGDGSDSGDISVASQGDRLQINVWSEHANDMTLTALLEYLYTDAFTLLRHKKSKLRLLAVDLCMHELRALCEDAYARKFCVQSTFAKDMSALLDDPTYADVLLTVGAADEDANTTAAVLDGGSMRGGSAEQLHQKPLLYAHKAVLCRIPYFETIMHGSFRETVMRDVPSPSGTRPMLCLSMDSFLSDGIDASTVVALVTFAYTGQLSTESASLSVEAPPIVTASADGDVDWMSLLVLSDRLRYTALSRLCERQLSLHLADVVPDNAINVLGFARAFNFARLESQAEDILANFSGEESH